MDLWRDDLGWRTRGRSRIAQTVKIHPRTRYHNRAAGLGVLLDTEDDIGMPRGQFLLQRGWSLLGARSRAHRRFPAQQLANPSSKSLPTRLSAWALLERLPVKHGVRQRGPRSPT